MYEQTRVKRFVCFIMSTLQIEKDIKVSLTHTSPAVTQKKVKQVNQKTFRFKSQSD